MKKNLFGYKIIFWVIFAIVFYSINKSLEAMESKATYELKKDEIKKVQDKLKEAEAKLNDDARKKELEDAKDKSKRYANLAATYKDNTEKKAYYDELISRATAYENKVKSIEQQNSDYQKIIQDAQAEMVKLTKQLQNLAAIWAPVEAFAQEIEDKMIGQSLGNQMIILKEEVANILNKSNYDEQLRYLNELVPLMRNLEFDIHLNTMSQYETKLIQDRIAQIEEFKKNKPKIRNAFEKDLKLDQMIPSDQVTALENKLFTIGTNLIAAIDKDDVAKLTDYVNQFIQVKLTINHFDLSKSPYTEVAQNTKMLSTSVDNFTRAIESIKKNIISRGLQKGLTPEEKALWDLIQNSEKLVLSEESTRFGADFPKKMFNAGAQIAIDTPLLNPYIKDFGKKIQAGKKDTDNVSFLMSKAPKIVEWLVYVAKKINTAFDKIRSAIQIIPSRVIRDVLNKPGNFVQNITQKIIENEAKYVSIAKASVRTAPWIDFVNETRNNIGDIAKNVKTTAEQQALISEIEKASAMIDKLRLEFPNPEDLENEMVATLDGKQTKLGQLFDAIKEFFAQLAQELKSLFINQLTQIDAAEKEYETQLSRMGLDTNLSPEELSAQLEKIIADPKKQNDVNKLTQAMQKVAQANKNIMDTIESAMTGMKFVILGWDTIVQMQPDSPDVVKRVSAVVQDLLIARDMQLYHQAKAREGLQVMQQVLGEIQDARGKKLSDDIVSQLADLISRQEITIIRKNAEAADLMAQDLKDAKEKLSKTLNNKQTKIP